jgi:hypothetical protein
MAARRVYHYDPLTAIYYPFSLIVEVTSKVVAVMMLLLPAAALKAAPPAPSAPDAAREPAGGRGTQNGSISGLIKINVV